MEDLEKRAQEIAKQEKFKEQQELAAQDNEGGIIVSVGTETGPRALCNSFDQQAGENGLVQALSDNAVAIQMAKESYSNLKNQKKIGKQIGNVVKRNTQADIDTANLTIQEKKKNNKVRQAEIKNALLKLRNDRIYLEKEHKHRLEMQRAVQLKEKYEDLLLRTCRKKQKGDDGKYHFVNDKDGNPIVNIPSKFRFFWIRLFDGLVSTLNQTAEIFGALNKNVLKGGLVILVLLLLLVPPFRNWILGLIGIKF